MYVSIGNIKLVFPCIMLYFKVIFLKCLFVMFYLQPHYKELVKI